MRLPEVDMKEAAKTLTAIAVVLIIALVVAACAPKNWQNVGAKTFKGLPVPESARQIAKGNSAGVPAIFASEMSMEQAAKWYEKQLKSAGLIYEKSPEKPKDEGYTIFDIKDESRAKKVVIVDDSNKTGANIQIF